MLCLFASLVFASGDALAQGQEKADADPQPRHVTASPVAGTPTNNGSQGASRDEPTLVVPRATYLDTELAERLHDASVLADWFEVAGVAAESSLIAVVSNATYEAARDELLADLASLGQLRQAATQAQHQLTQIAEQIEALRALQRSIVRDIVTQERDGFPTPTGIDAHRAIQDAEALSFGIEFGPEADTARLTRIASEARDLLVDQLATIDRQPALSAKEAQRFVASLHVVHDDLAVTGTFIDFGQSRVQFREIDAERQRDVVVEQMPALHEQRRLASTAVGLPLVTLDAYISGATRAEPSCPVDWALLAGIGRIESGHGTVDDARVLSSGNVTVPILGPLLDGGATEREAADALRAAEEAAALELALLEEERLAKEAAFVALQADLYGIEIVEEPEDDAVEPEPALDVLGRPIEIEGDELDDGDSEGSEDEEPELLGNGFAVIEDSDNGRLDGNDRWDRAVGPMQFIPETWSVMQADGNDDGVRNPQNLFDAAATAADFLCRLSSTRGSSPEDFVLGYNGSTSYVDSVLTFARGYRSKSVSIDWLVDP